MLTGSRAFSPAPLMRSATARMSALSSEHRSLRMQHRQEAQMVFRQPTKSGADAAFSPAVTIVGSASLKRNGLSWPGVAAEAVQVARDERVEFRFRGSRHLLVVYTRGARRAGETLVTGLSASKLRQLERRLTFVPAGRDYFEWQEPCSLVNLTFLYIDPARAPANRGSEAPLAPRLLFEDATLFDTALKLTGMISSHDAGDQLYAEALGTVLAHELLCPSNAESSEALARGGLAPWQQRIVTEYVEEHLAEHIPLDALARLAGLSRYYFCRAFKQSLGVPPHRYHNNRRIEHSKALLVAHGLSVTETGFQVGFSDTSSFSAAFRKITGLTPTAYLRNTESGQASC
jgi:AraC family transcriptional regulator